MRARVLALVLLASLGGCTDSEFLQGVRCGGDRDCGRSLSCEHRVCGGCPPEVPLVKTGCACPGDRVLDCRALPAPHCMPVCRSARDLCEVAEVTSDSSAPKIRSCDDTESSTERCFDVVFGDSECEGEARIVLQNGEPAGELIVNCPPPESDESRFDCEPP